MLTKYIYINNKSIKIINNLLKLILIIGIIILKNLHFIETLQIY